MSIDEQIDEMAKVICHAPTCEIRKNGGTCYKYCKSYIYAFRAINAGYCKTAEVAREIFAEIDDFQRTLRNIFLGMCGGNDYNTLNLLQIDNAIEALFDSHIAELKKKYESEEVK